MLISAKIDYVAILGLHIVREEIGQWVDHGHFIIYSFILIRSHAIVTYDIINLLCCHISVHDEGIHFDVLIITIC